MTVSWCFSQPQLERALSSVWPWQAWIIRRFLLSTLATQHKLIVQPSLSTRGLSPEGAYRG